MGLPESPHYSHSGLLVGGSRLSPAIPSIHGLRIGINFALILKNISKNFPTNWRAISGGRSCCGSAIKSNAPAD